MNSAAFPQSGTTLPLPPRGFQRKENVEGRFDVASIAPDMWLTAPISESLRSCRSTSLRRFWGTIALNPPGAAASGRRMGRIWQPASVQKP
jgi:hypothetical protein